MKKIFFILVVLLPLICHGFTLVTNPPIKFGTNEVTINISNNDCDQSNYTVYQIHDMIQKAVDQFWNSASTSALVLKRGGVTTDDLGSARFSEVRNAAAPGTILIACSDNAIEFPDEFTAGKGGISSVNGVIRGALILNNRTAGKLSGMTENQRLALIAHELGHAIGLSHSADKIALMYYTLDGKDQTRLTRDDRAGVTYLYPYSKKKIGCGAVDLGDNNIGMMFFNIIFGIMAVFLISKVFARNIDVRNN